MPADDSWVDDARRGAGSARAGAADGEPAPETGLSGLADAALNHGQRVLAQAAEHLQAHTASLTTAITVRLPNQQWVLAALAGAPLADDTALHAVLTEHQLRTALTDGTALGPLHWLPADAPATRVGWAVSVLQDADGVVFAAVFTKYAQRSAVTVSDIALIDRVSHRLVRALVIQRRDTASARLRALRRRDRLSRKLLDDVLQTMFAAGLRLDIAADDLPPDTRARLFIDNAVHDLDGVADQLREHLRGVP